MQQNKMMEIISWLRVLAFTGSLYFLFRSDTLAQLIGTNILEETSPIFILLGAYFIASLVPVHTFKLCLNFWNKVTPLKDKPTFIETELVYLLSVVPATSIILLLGLKIPLQSFILLNCLIFVTALPTIIICYLACRIFLKSAIKMAEIAAELTETEIKTDLENSEEHNYLETPENTLIPFLLAALIFCLVISLMVTVVVFMRGAGFHVKIFTSTMSLCAITIILLTFLGQNILNIGASIQTRLGMTPFTSKRSIASAWVLGIMISLTGFILLFSSHRLPTSLTGWLEAWPSVVAYGIIVLGSLLSGIVLSLFYKKKPLSVVFI